MHSVVKLLDIPHGAGGGVGGGQGKGSYGHIPALVQLAAHCVWVVCPAGQP